MGLSDLFEDDALTLLTTLVVIAIAAIVINYLRGFLGPPPQPQHQPQIPPLLGNQQQQQPPPQPRSSSSSSIGQQQQQSSGTTFRTITLSAPGVILQEQTPESLSDGATILPTIVKTLQPLLARRISFFIICQVEDDIGEAAVRGALEFSGIVGPNQDQIPPQRLLFCSTAPGKISLVRQLEPDLHLDASADTVKELQRFLKRVVHISSLNSGIMNSPSLESALSSSISL